MKRRSKVIAFLLIVFLFIVPVHSFAQVNNDLLDESFNSLQQNYEKQSAHFKLANYKDKEINNKQIIIKVKDNTFDHTQFDVHLIDEIIPHLYVVKVKDDANYWETFNALKSSKHVLHVEPDVIIEPTFELHDPFAREQWYLQSIDMKRAWEIERGSKDITIAVLDSGVNRNHPDLKGRVLQGYDFINNKVGATDDNGHGTHIAGVIAANINNIGIAGIDHHVKILPVKVFHNKGKGTLTDALKGIYYAIDQNADIINMSYVVDEKSELEKEALLKASEKGIILVASSGNDGIEKSAYPASYPFVISVGATDTNDKRAKFSNYGIGLDLTAPGEYIYSTHFSGGYGTGSGTSFATPIVSAVAGLIKAKHSDWNQYDIEWALQYGAELPQHINEEWHKQLGYGRVNAYNSLTAQLPNKKDDISDTSRHAYELKDGDSVKETFQLPNDVDWYTFELTNKSDVHIDMTNIPKHIDLVAVLFKMNENKIEEITIIDNGNIGKSESFKQQMDEGTYYISLFDSNNRWSEQPYKLTFKATIAQFPDVKQYKNEIQYLVEKRIIRGFEDGTFRPERSVTRLQAVTMILNEMGIDVEKEAKTLKNPHFKDMPLNSYGYNQVAKAVDLGFIKGKEDNRFDPYGYLTRAQMAAILAKAYELQGDYNGQFNDVNDNHWAYRFVSSLAANGIVKGYQDNTYRPDESISRQHFSLMLYNVMQQKK